MRRLLLLAFFAFPAGLPAADKTPGVVADKDKKTVTIDAIVAPRKLPDLPDVYPIEVIACWPAKNKDKPDDKKGEKAHETVVTIEADPSAVHQALEDIGLKPGKPAKGEGTEAAGPDVTVVIEVPAGDGPAKRLTPDKFLVDPKTKKPFPKGVKFRFTGSIQEQISPDKPEKKYGADLSGTLIAIFPVTDKTVLQSSLTMKEEKYLKLETNKDTLPKEGTAVKLVLEAAGK